MAWVLQIHVIETRVFEVMHYSWQQISSYVQCFQLSYFLKFPLHQINIACVSHIGSMQVSMVGYISSISFVNFLDKCLKFGIVK